MSSKESFFGISAWADVAAAKQDCSDQSDATIGLGATNIAAWMVESLPSASRRVRPSTSTDSPPK